MTQETEITTRETLNLLKSWVGDIGTLTMKNVFPLGYGYECDVLRVRKSLCWGEFELKISVADYRKDFQKCITSHKRTEGRWVAVKKYKHESLSSSVKNEGEVKPRTFSFVLPDGLIDLGKVPLHCGVVFFHMDQRLNRLVFKTARKAPVLKHSTKITPIQLFNLALKAKGN